MRNNISLSVPNLAGSRFLIVQSSYYEDIGAMLLAGARAMLEAGGVKFEVLTAPGALEIPIVAAIGLEARGFDGVIALGCIVRGETFHFEIVAMESARAFMDLSVRKRIPSGNGILTVETLAQAQERADPERGNKGGEAARAALIVADLQRHLS